MNSGALLSRFGLFMIYTCVFVLHEIIKVVQRLQSLSYIQVSNDTEFVLKIAARNIVFVC